MLGGPSPPSRDIGPPGTGAVHRLFLTCESKINYTAGFHAQRPAKPPGAAPSAPSLGSGGVGAAPGEGLGLGRGSRAPVRGACGVLRAPEERGVPGRWRAPRVAVEAEASEAAGRGAGSAPRAGSALPEPTGAGALGRAGGGEEAPRLAGCRAVAVVRRSHWLPRRRDREPAPNPPLLAQKCFSGGVGGRREKGSSRPACLLVLGLALPVMNSSLSSLEDDRVSPRWVTLEGTAPGAAGWVTPARERGPDPDLGGVGGGGKRLLRGLQEAGRGPGRSWGRRGEGNPALRGHGGALLVPALAGLPPRHPRGSGFISHTPPPPPPPLSFSTPSSHKSKDL